MQTAPQEPKNAHTKSPTHMTSATLGSDTKTGKKPKGKAAEFVARALAQFTNLASAALTYPFLGWTAQPSATAQKRHTIGRPRPRARRVTVWRCYRTYLFDSSSALPMDNALVSDPNPAACWWYAPAAAPPPHPLTHPLLQAAGAQPYAPPA